MNIELYQDDFVLRVSGETRLSELDQYLRSYKQESFLLGPADYSISQILTENWGAGAASSCLGMTVLHANGQESKIGGKVIKNVSGFDLAKLYIGSDDNLVSIKEAFLRTNKLAEHQIDLYYQGANLASVAGSQDAAGLSSYPKEFLDKLNKENIFWDDFDVCLDIDSGEQSLCFKLRGDQDLVELRAKKLESLFGAATNIEAKAYQGKDYSSKQNRIEFYTKFTLLETLVKVLCPHEAKLRVYPLQARIDLMPEDINSFIAALSLAKKDLLAIEYYAHLYPLDHRSEERLNVHVNNAEREIFTKLKQVYNRRKTMEVSS